MVNMNRLSTAQRVAVTKALVEGNSIRSTVRMTGVAKKIANMVTVLTAQKSKEFHLVIQSAGGTVADGMFLYNLLRSSSLEITTYNIGSVMSAGVIVYLGGKIRKASTLATFMTHRTSGPFLSANSSQLKALTQSVSLDDQRTETVLKTNLALPDELWADLWRHDLHWSAQDAVTIGLAHKVEEFMPTPGSPILTF
jgi:ATP-dependent Clp protease protease subunit